VSQLPIQASVGERLRIVRAVLGISEEESGGREFFV
jgi:hypothetical protein